MKYDIHKPKIRSATYRYEQAMTTKATECWYCDAK